MATSSLLMVTVKGRRGVNCGFSSSALNESGFLPGKASIHLIMCGVLAH